MNKRSLVFGANGTIGRAISNHISDKYEMFYADLPSTSSGFISDVRRQSEYDIDASQYSPVYDLMVQINPDIIVNAVGINISKSLNDIDKDEWWYVIHINLGTHFNILKSLEAIALIENKDRIYIAIGSNSVFVPRSNSSAYCVSKAAMFSLTQNSAREFGKLGLSIYPIEIDPGFVYPSNMSENTLSNRGISVDQAVYRSPYKKTIHPNEIGKLVAYLSENGKPFAGDSIRMDYAEV